ncbi:MAG: ABC-2 family transporter protein [Bacilli bacterium]|nr:ABC-2 family transporter protein [Bacilli bacterium]
MKNIKLAILNIKKNFQNEKELKSAFITSIIGMCINNIAFILLWFNFGKIAGNLNGWEPFDIIGLYGFSTTSYGLVFSIFYGIQNLPNYISTGNFDKYLLTPKNILLKVATSAVSTSAIGDFLFGFICYIIFMVTNHFTLLQILISLLFLVISSIVYFSFTVISMSLSFYFMDGENISDGLFQMLLTPSFYHGGAFSKGLRIVFTFVIPSLVLGAIPVEIIKNITVGNVCFVLGIAVFWFLFSIWFFYTSLKKYESNNFFGFGG